MEPTNLADPLVQEAADAYATARAAVDAARADLGLLPTARQTAYLRMRRCLALEWQFTEAYPYPRPDTWRHPAWYAARIAELLAPRAGGIGWPPEADVHPVDRDDHLLPKGWR